MVAVNLCAKSGMCNGNGHTRDMTVLQGGQGSRTGAGLKAPLMNSLLDTLRGPTPPLAAAGARGCLGLPATAGASGSQTTWFAAARASWPHGSQTAQLRLLRGEPKNSGYDAALIQLRCCTGVTHLVGTSSRVPG